MNLAKEYVVDRYICGVVYCPLSKYEQDVDLCLDCSQFNGYKKDNTLKARSLIDCKYDKVTRGSKVYKDEEGSKKCTVVAGDPFPDGLEKSEKWTRC